MIGSDRKGRANVTFCVGSDLAKLAAYMPKLRTEKNRNVFMFPQFFDQVKGEMVELVATRWPKEKQ